MEHRLTEGTYEKFGVQISGNQTIFTFAGEKEDTCAILFYGKEDQIIERIEVPGEYCRGSIRSVAVEGLSPKRLRYNYEINGVVQTDVYAGKIIGRERFADLERKSQRFAVCGGIADSTFDWEGDVAPEVPRSQMVMYKLHVRGFSMDAGVRGKKRGTFAAVQKKISYLKNIGITTVEFMPVYEFEELVLKQPAQMPDYVQWEQKETDCYQPQETTVERINYWGYAPGNYFAVKASYSSTENAAAEWKALIKELHKNGMECVMELYFGAHMNQNVILDVLRYWVSEFHVDGFHLLGQSLPVTAIAQDLLLSRTKIFYSGFEQFLLEQKSRYPHLYAYNDEYYYPIRKMLNQMGGRMTEFTDQQRRQNEQLGFVNFVANNNGFTLADLFSYAQKHNEDNGEDNADGNDWNYSCNCGVEGRTLKHGILELRERKLLNAFAILFAAQGVPLFYSGDEFGNSQQGNNNAYCQDNRIGWLNWKRQEKYSWLTEFVRKLAAFRREHPVLSKDVPMTLTDAGHKGVPDLSYHGEKAWMGGVAPERQAIGMLYCGAYAKKADGSEDDFLYIGYNFGNGVCELALPKLPEKKKWYQVMNTARGRDAFLEDGICAGEQNRLQTAPQSVVYLIGK